MVVLARIDDRLIHGQVVVGWVKTLGADHLVIVSDEIARDDKQKKLYEMVVPSHLKVSFLDFANAAQWLNSVYSEKDRVILLFSRPRDVVSLLNKKCKLSKVNVGGMHYVVGKKEIYKSVFVDDEDVDCLKDIASRKIVLEAQAAASDEPVDIIKHLGWQIEPQTGPKKPS
jgi:mannose/fructose/sorbose-specific phosphotransferase system IIB component